MKKITAGFLYILIIFSAHSLDVPNLDKWVADYGDMISLKRVIRRRSLF